MTEFWTGFVLGVAVTGVGVCVLALAWAFYTGRQADDDLPGGFL